MNHREKIDISAWKRAELFQEFINIKTSVLRQVFKFTSIIIINNVKFHANST